MKEIERIEELINEKKLKDAEKIIYEQLDSSEDSSSLYNQLGIIRYLEKKEDEAIELFKKTIKLNFANQSAVFNLTELLNIHSKKKDAVEVLTDYIAIRPDDFEAREILKRLEEESSGKAKEIINRFKEFELLKPKVFTFETSLACNLKCPECAIGGGMISREKGFLPFDKFKILADKIKPFAEYLYLHLWGEPMLNKEIINMIKYASQFCAVNISTNGTLLSKEKSEQLILSGVRDLIVSIDGVSQNIYEKYRVGGEVEKAFAALSDLVQFNIKYDAKVNIMPQFIVFKHNQDEIEDFKEICNSLGLTPTFKAPYIRTDDSNFQMSDFKEYQRHYYKTEESLKTAMMDCVNPKEVFTVNVDGTSIICCHDYDKFTDFGNLFENDVLEIWNSPIYRDYRWKILSGETPSFCMEKCMSYMMETETIDNKNESVLPTKDKIIKINLCGGPSKIDEYINVDISPNSDIILDLEKELLPFEDNSVDELICISAINYFSVQRGFEIIKDVFRVLKPRGIVRFATQDLRILAEKYLNRDQEFFNQKLANGHDRFPGISFADKFSQWFYGFETGGKRCKYVYDFETLRILFENAGFTQIEEKKYLESRIKNIKKIDNRPEQMFFLEAIKPNHINIVDSIESGNLPNGLKKQFIETQNWQQILENLGTQKGNKELVVEASKIIKSDNNFKDLSLLISNYLTVVPDDTEMTGLLEKVNSIKIAISSKKESNRVDSKEIEKLDLTRSNPLDDDIHLDAAMKWLKRAFDVKEKIGISSVFDLNFNEWLVSYPETTGYIIPTFIAYSKLKSDTSYLESAMLMGEWEKSLQWSNGGIGEPIGVYGQKPRIFNTSQVMLGWLNIYHETKDNSYFNALIKAADWIVASQDKDGKWTKNTYMGAKTYHSRVAWVLSEIYEITGDQKYFNSITRYLKWALSNSDKNGWFANTSLSEPDKPWTHLYGYTLYGLEEILKYKHFSNFKEEFDEILEPAANNLAKLVFKNNKPYLGLPGIIDQDFNSNVSWTCLTGDAQIAIFLRKAGSLFNNNEFISASEKLIEELKEVHLIHNIFDKNIFGGVAGSYPINGDYCRYSIPNWSTKFFADSIFQKKMDYQDFNFLG